MSTLLIGILGFFGALWIGFDKASAGLYANPHALYIVIGGSIAVFFFSNPWSGVRTVLQCVRALLSPDVDFDNHREELNELSERRSLSKPSKDPMIQYAVELWEQGVSPEMFVVLLSQQRSRLETPLLESTQSLRNLAKYPPALGMVGTVMGLVALFSDLGGNDKSRIGPALAVAMTATFFGLVAAHGIVMPLADRLNLLHLKHRAHYSALYEILLLINRQEASGLVAQEVRHREVA